MGRRQADRVAVSEGEWEESGHDREESGWRGGGVRAIVGGVRFQVTLTIEGHVLDESNLQWLLLRQRHEIQQLVLVQAAHHHAVHLQGAAQHPVAL